MDYTQEIQDLADQFAREQEQEYEFIAATYVGVKDGVALFVPMEEDSKYYEKRFFGMIAILESGPEFITRRDDRFEDYLQFYRENYDSMVKRGLEVYRSLIRQLNECKLSSSDVSYVCALLEGMPDPDAHVDFPHFYCHPPTFLIYLEAAERLHKHLVFASDTKRVQFVTVV